MSSIIEVDSASPGIKYTDVCHHGSSVGTCTCTLKIPHQILYDWDKCNVTALSDEELIAKLNQTIKGEVVAIKTTSHRLAEKLRKAMYRIGSNVYKCNGGRRREEILQKEYHLFVLAGETESSLDLGQQLVKVREELESWKKIATERSLEIDNLLEDMATDYDTLYDEIYERDSVIKSLQCEHNTGKKIHEVAERQAKRKLQQVKQRTLMALQFAETFGLMPSKVEMKKATGEQVFLNFVHKWRFNGL